MPTEYKRRGLPLCVNIAAFLAAWGSCAQLLRLPPVGVENKRKTLIYSIVSRTFSPVFALAAGLRLPGLAGLPWRTLFGGAPGAS